MVLAIGNHQQPMALPYSTIKKKLHCLVAGVQGVGQGNLVQAHFHATFMPVLKQKHSYDTKKCWNLNLDGQPQPCGI